jgi:hypothetical protein
MTFHAGQKGFQLSEFAKELDHISTAGCPEPFRLAWLDFVQTVERDSSPFSGLGSLGEYTVSVFRGSSSGMKDALARLDRLDAPEAERRLEIVALNYGVQLTGR